MALEHVLRSSITFGGQPAYKDNVWVRVADNVNDVAPLLTDLDPSDIIEDATAVGSSWSGFDGTWVRDRIEIIRYVELVASDGSSGSVDTVDTERWIYVRPFYKSDNRNRLISGEDGGWILAAAQHYLDLTTIPESDPGERLATQGETEDLIPEATIVTEAAATATESTSVSRRDATAADADTNTSTEVSTIESALTSAGVSATEAQKVARRSV